MRELPSPRTVVGSGRTGEELASADLERESEVMLVSAGRKVLPGNEGDAAELIEGVFKRKGMNILRNARATSVKT